MLNFKFEEHDYICGLIRQVYTDTGRPTGLYMYNGKSISKPDVDALINQFIHDRIHENEGTVHHEYQDNMSNVFDGSFEGWD